MDVSGTILHGEALRVAAAPLRDEVGRADRERLDALVLAAGSARTSLARCLEVTFPGLAVGPALPALEAFRERLNGAAAAASPSLELRFEVDDQRRLAPDERECWFTGPDPAVAGATRYSEQVTGDVVGKPLIRHRGIATTSSALESGKRLVRFFLSYAHADRRLAEGLLAELQKQCSGAARYEYQIWSDGRLLLGERWRDGIERAIDCCDLGLLLVSPAFLGSEYIQQQELPRFTGCWGKPVVPVGLAKVDLAQHDLRGLQEHQLFLREGRSFEETSKRGDFAHQLFKKLQERLDAYFDQPAAALDECIPMPAGAAHFQRTRGYRAALRDLERPEAPIRDQAHDAIAEIEAWAVAEDSPPFFALLGEYGMGKTTTLRHLTHDFLRRRKAGERLPLPLYMDLRDFVPASRDAVPTIHDLLATIIERSWKVRDRSVTPEAVLRLVREEGALILFDGLDERLVHLTPDRAREFIRALWAVLPDATRPADALQPGQRRGKLLISCRSHYFRDVWSQSAMLVGEDREGLERGRFPTFCLVPFSEAQIRGYLASLLGGEDQAVEAFDLIASIHNLPDLARRPYLLKLIGDQISELEELRARGEKVNAARLYGLMVRSWLNRDDGKHQLEPAHKRRLMEALAAALWRSGSKEWDADRLEDWFDDYLASNPTLAGAYANKDRAVLKEDLRTATFVLRPDGKQQSFRFAHTSLQEYFLASHLARALAEGDAGALDLPMVSDETLDFLGQILSVGPAAPALRTMEAALEGERIGAALIAFLYWLKAMERGHPLPAPARVNLAGADLEDWTILGPEGQSPLRLRGANLSGARLNRARLENVDLGGADLTGIEARQALFLRVSARRARAGGADLSGAQWRGGSLEAADLVGARLAGCHWIDVDLSEAKLPDDWQGNAESIGWGPVEPRERDASGLAVPAGHGNTVTSCAWSPGGDLVLSASADSTLKLWDAASGRCVRTLAGHSVPVQACAWSPDGRLLLSGADDGTLKVWDAAAGLCSSNFGGPGEEGHSGAVTACAWSANSQFFLSASADGTLRVWDVYRGQLFTALEGHSGAVTACAWNPASGRVLSGGDDGTLRVWEVSSGRCRLRVQAHSSGVAACAWAPRGDSLLSASGDGVLKIWDAESGKCLQTLEGHSGAVLACAWSPDGARILSASEDESLMVWDAASGRCLQTLEGHLNYVQACAWSPDGARILSGSGDDELKVWDARSGRCLLHLESSFNFAWACAWSPAGDQVLSGSGDNTLKVSNVGTGECRLTLAGHAGWVLTCAWSPRGDRLLSGSWDGTLKVWDSVSGRCLLTLDGHDRPVWDCAWSPQGDRILSASGDRTLKVWDADSGRCLRTLEEHARSVFACAWSPRGDRLLSGSGDQTMKVWDAASGECLRTLTGHSGWVLGCEWSPTGDRILSASEDKTLRIWDADSGRSLRTLVGHSATVRTCAWSPGGDQVLSGSDDGTLRVWRLTWEGVQTLSGHANAVWTCAWNPRADLVLSGSADNTLKVWSPVSGQCVETIHLLPEGQVASIDEVRERILYTSLEAWRWLGWRAEEPKTRLPRIIPFV